MGKVNNPAGRRGTIPWSDVLEMRRLYDVEFRKTGYIAALFPHIAYKTISYIVRGQARHSDGAISDADVLEMRRLHARGYKLHDIEALYPNVSYRHICSIVRRVTRTTC